MVKKWQSEKIRNKYLVAKKLVGKKAVLTGGGGFFQDFSIVKVLKVKKIQNAPFGGGFAGQAKVKGGIVREPILVSWTLEPLNSKAMRVLTLGEYRDNLNGTATNKTTGEVFGKNSLGNTIKIKGRGK